MLLVKLADRLHNMRTLHHMKEEKRGRIAQETMEIYAPLAGRMGMQSMREELQDLSFLYISPAAHDTITSHLSELAVKNKDLISQITSELSQKLKQSKIAATVTSRQKRPFSISKKMENKALAFEQLSDIYGFRIIVENVEGLLPRPWFGPHHLVVGSWPHQGLYLDGQTKRLQIHSHDGHRPLQPAC